MAAEIRIEMENGARLLRGADRCWELCDLINVKRDDEVVQEWRPYKFFTLIATAFKAVVEEKVRASTATNIAELQAAIKEAKDEITRIYDTDFDAILSVSKGGQTGTDGSDAAAALGGQPVERTCSCGGNCGKRSGIDSKGSRRGKGGVPDTGAVLGAGPAGPAGAGRAGIKGAENVSASVKKSGGDAPPVQRKPRAGRNKEVR